MQDGLLHELRLQRAHTRERWAALLRTERPHTPLGNPEALVHLIDWSLDEIFRDLGQLASRRRAGLRSGDTVHRPECPCGRNPLLAYFAAGEQSMREALVLAQVAMTELVATERDAALAEVDLVLQQLARREIEAFCGVCQFRSEPTLSVVTGASAHAG